MTNGEKYKKAFSVLQTSKGSLQEVENMAKFVKTKYQGQSPMHSHGASLFKTPYTRLSLVSHRLPSLVILHMQRMLEASSARFRYGSMAIRRRRP